MNHRIFLDILRKNLTIIVPVAIAFVFSILFIKFYGFEKIEFGDSEDYINAANAILHGMEYPRQSIAHPMFRPPLFPFFIAGIWTIFPQSIVAVKIAQALLHAASVFVIYQIAYEILRRRMPAFFGALVCAINPLLVAHTVDFYTEPLHTFLCALAMLFLIKFLKNDKSLYLKAIYTGIVFGLATLCRPAILGVAICLIPVIVLLQIKESARFKYFVATAVMFVSIFLAIAPWTFYNYRTTGEFILVNDGFSYNLWLGNLPETIQLYEGQFKSKEENQEFANHVWGEVQVEKLKELERSDNYYSLSYKDRETVWRREALKNMTADYGLTARLMYGKLKSFWTPFLNQFSYGFKIVALVALFVIGTYLFGAYGAYIFSRDKIGRKFVVLLAVSFVVTTAIHVLIFGFVRYRVPNIDPYLSMLAGGSLWQLIGSRIFPQFNENYD